MLPPISGRERVACDSAEADLQSPSKGDAPSVPGDLVPAIHCLGKTDHLARCFRKPWYDSVVGSFPELTSHRVGCMSNVIS